MVFLRRKLANRKRERESKGNYRIHVGACWRRYKKYSPAQASPVCVLVWWITLYVLHAPLCTSPRIFTANAHFWSLLGATIPPTNKQNWGFLETNPTSQQEQKQAAAARIPPPQKSKISQKFSSCGSKSRSWGSLDMHHLQTRIVLKCWWWWWWSGSSLESCECSSLRDYLPKTRNFMGLLVCSFWIWSRKETGLILLCLKVLDSRIIQEKARWDFLQHRHQINNNPFQQSCVCLSIDLQLTASLSSTLWVIEGFLLVNFPWQQC